MYLATCVYESRNSETARFVRSLFMPGWMWLGAVSSLPYLHVLERRRYKSATQRNVDSIQLRIGMSGSIGLGVNVAEIATRNIETHSMTSSFPLHINEGSRA
jgi:hypothetical protein